jgi:hypothetical protein
MNETKTLDDVLSEWSDEYSENTIDLSGIHSNVSITSPYTVTLGSNFPNTIFTTNGTNTLPWLTASPNGPASTSTKINLNGENADIEVNGWSLVAAVKRIEARLDLFQPNPELESEWEELRSLGEQYRALEQQLKDKQATWDRLKAMPPPELD